MWIRLDGRRFRYIVNRELCTQNNNNENVVLLQFAFIVLDKVNWHRFLDIQHTFSDKRGDEETHSRQGQGHCQDERDAFESKRCHYANEANDTPRKSDTEFYTDEK